MLRLTNVNEETANKIKTEYGQYWKNQIDITGADYGLYDISIHTGVPVIIKGYNSDGEVTLDLGCNMITLYENDYSEIKIL